MLLEKFEGLVRFPTYKLNIYNIQQLLVTLRVPVLGQIPKQETNLIGCKVKEERQVS